MAAGPMREGGTSRVLAHEKEVTRDEDRSILSRRQPGRLRSFSYPVRPLHRDAGGGSGNVSDRGLTAKGAVPVAAPFLLVRPEAKPCVRLPARACVC